MSALIKMTWEMWQSMPVSPALKSHRQKDPDWRNIHNQL